jgi:uracil-DNA glycosylase
MLRLLGKRRQGLPLNEEENKRLDSWLETMRRENAVVAFDPVVTPSVFYVDRRPEDLDDLPIRRQRVWLNPLQH